MIEDLLRDALDDSGGIVPDRLVDDAVRDGYRLRQRRRRVAAIPIVVLLGAAVAVTVALRSDFESPAPTGHPIPQSVATPTVTTSTVSPPTTARPLELSSRLWPIGNVRAVVSDGRAIDVIVAPGGGRGSNVIRVDPSTGKTLARSEQFDSAFGLVRAGSWLWISDWPTKPGGGHVGGLVQLDPATLKVHRRVALAEQWTPALTGNDTVLWAATNTHLYRLDADRGTIVRSVPIEGQDPAPLADVALDPGGRWLWVAQPNVGLDPQNPQKPYSPLVLTRRDPLTGAVEMQRRDLPSVAGGTILPVTDGIWVAASGGHFVFVTRLDARTLATDATWNHSNESVGPNGATVNIAGNRLWILNRVPSTTIACGDVNTGAVLATRRLANVPDGSAITVADNHLVIATTAGLAIADVPSPCRIT